MRKTVWFTFFSVALGFLVSFMQQFRLSMRMFVIRQWWITLLLGTPSAVWQIGEAAVAKATRFFFRDSRLVQIPA